MSSLLTCSHSSSGSPHAHNVLRSYYHYNNKETFASPSVQLEEDMKPLDLELHYVIPRGHQSLMLETDSIHWLGQKCYLTEPSIHKGKQRWRLIHVVSCSLQAGWICGNKFAAILIQRVSNLPWTSYVQKLAKKTASAQTTHKLSGEAICDRI